MKKITTTQRVIAIFHGEPLDKAEMLLELAQGIVDVRLGVNGPALSGKPRKRKGRVNDITVHTDADPRKTLNQGHP